MDRLDRLEEPFQNIKSWWLKKKTELLDKIFVGEGFMDWPNYETKKKPDSNITQQASPKFLKLPFNPIKNMQNTFVILLVSLLITAVVVCCVVLGAGIKWVGRFGYLLEDTRVHSVRLAVYPTRVQAFVLAQNATHPRVVLQKGWTWIFPRAPVAFGLDQQWCRALGRCAFQLSYWSILHYLWRLLARHRTT